MAYALYIAAVIVVFQGVLSLIEGFKFRAYVRKHLGETQEDFFPRAAVILPCKGIDSGLDENVAALLKQDYPHYRVIISIASEDDPARRVIERTLESFRHIPAELVIAGRSSNRSEKVNNLISAVKRVRPDTEVLVFADSDVRMGPGWLRALVAPLANRNVGAASGYRWYLPASGGFFAHLLSAWNGSIATMLVDQSRNFAWGGSTAILSRTYREIGVLDRWNGAASDDYALTAAVKESGLQIDFVPRCLLVSREDPSLTNLLEFTTRQIVITRVYHPVLWWTGLISHSLFCGVFFGGSAFVVWRLVAGQPAGLAAALLAIIFFLGSLKGWLRLAAASEALRFAAGEIRRQWWIFCFLWPLVSLLFLFNFLKSATTRCITWRGVRYEMRSPTETRVTSTW